MAQTVAEETRTGPLGRQSAAVPDVPRPRRVVLKLSGEVFGGGEGGVDPDTVQEMGRQIARVVIFGAGAGMPYFSTDTVAAQRALEIHADIVLMSKNGVDGVYTADPNTDPTAIKIDRMTFDEALRQGLRVADAAAFSLCMDN